MLNQDPLHHGVRILSPVPTSFSRDPDTEGSLRNSSPGSFCSRYSWACTSSLVKQMNLEHILLKGPACAAGRGSELEVQVVECGLGTTFVNCYFSKYHRPFAGLLPNVTPKPWWELPCPAKGTTQDKFSSARGFQKKRRTTWFNSDVGYKTETCRHKQECVLPEGRGWGVGVKRASHTVTEDLTLGGKYTVQYTDLVS